MSACAKKGFQLQFVPRRSRGDTATSESYYNTYIAPKSSNPFLQYLLSMYNEHSEEATNDKFTVTITLPTNASDPHILKESKDGLTHILWALYRSREDAQKTKLEGKGLSMQLQRAYLFVQQYMSEQGELGDRHYRAPDTNSVYVKMKEVDRKSVTSGRFLSELDELTPSWHSFHPSEDFTASPQDTARLLTLLAHTHAEGERKFVKGVDGPMYFLDRMGAKPRPGLRTQSLLDNTISWVKSKRLKETE